MNEPLLIALYVLASIITVPLLARAYYDPASQGFDGDTGFVIGMSVFTACLWPLWLALWLIFVAVPFVLKPLIFGSQPPASTEGTK